MIELCLIDHSSLSWQANFDNMFWTNYHSHTHYCDGSTHPENYVLSAIESGMVAYGFSAHAPVSFPTDWCVADDEFDAYIKEIQLLKGKYKDKIEIYQGLEIDYIPGVAGRRMHLVNKLELDFFIGSVHFVDSFEDGVHWNIDHSREYFEKGLFEIFGGNFKTASEKFYEISKQMIVNDKPNIIGHLDKIKMYNSGGRYFNEDEKWYRDQVEAVLKSIKASRAIVEINTRGYYRYNQEELYPSWWIIKRLAEEKIPVMLNSDSHSPDELTAGFAYAANILKDAGIRELWALVGNKWKAFDYSYEGLIL